MAPIQLFKKLTLLCIVQLGNAQIVGSQGVPLQNPALFGKSSALFDREKLLKVFKNMPGAQALVTQLEQGDTSKIIIMENPDCDYEGILLAGFHAPSLPPPSAIHMYHMHFWTWPSNSGGFCNFMCQELKAIKEIGAVAIIGILSGSITNIILKKYAPPLDATFLGITFHDILLILSGSIGAIIGAKGMVYAIEKSYQIVHAYAGIGHITLPPRDSLWAVNAALALPALYPLSTQWTSYPLSMQSIRAALRDALIPESSDEHQLSGKAVRIRTTAICTIDYLGFDDERAGVPFEAIHQLPL